MSFKPVTTIPAEFQFPEPPSNAKGLNTESFTATVIKDPGAWFNYFNDYHTKVMQFKSYYDAVVLEAQQLQNINTTLTEEVSAFTQHQAWLKIQLEALRSQQLQQRPTGAVKSERLPDPAIFDGSQDKLKEFLLKLRAKMMMNADRYPSS